MSSSASSSAHLVIVDALNLIRRIYAVQERQFNESDQQALALATQTTVISALRKITYQNQATHCCIVFDNGATSWRHQLSPEYKKGRKPMPSTLQTILPTLKKAFDEQHFCSIYHPDYEADDVIASLATKARRAQVTCTVVSTDKGFLQLLPEGVVIFDYFARQILDEQHCLKKFGVPSRQLALFWGLAGDTGNNISGISGIGKKSALTIIQQHQSLQDALTSDVLSEKIKEKLQNGLNDFKQSLQLVRLKTDIDLGYSLKDFRTS